MLTELSQRLVNMLRKHRDKFSSHPSVFFQTVLNEGGKALSREASSLLQDKYVDETFAEYLRKEPWHGGVLARFHCSSSVACLDVSPKLDYTVCECMNGILQLWSLDTDRLLWKHPVKVSKSYVDGCGAFRPSSTPVLSFCLSVFFYPSEDSDVVVLPGILSHAYTVVGDLKPLLSESKCRFSVCSISGDKTKILTDCPDDARCLVMWSLKNGSEIVRITRDEDVLSFAWSRDGRLLAISHSSGLICLVDTMSTFTTLAQTSTQQVCGTRSYRVLFCLHSRFLSSNSRLFRCDLRQHQHTFSVFVALDEVSYDSRKFTSFNGCGFSFGDPITGPPARQITFDFVLDKQILLRADPSRSHIKMLNTDDADEATVTIEYHVLEIALSLDAQTMYVVSDTETPGKPIVSAWDVSSGELVAQKYSATRFSICLVPVREGVLLATTTTTTTTDTSTLELWTSDLSERFRSCTNLPRIAKMIPVSEEQMACVESRVKVNILVVASFEIMSIIKISGRRVLACNSKFQLITIDDSGSLCLSDGPALLWEKALPPKDSISVRGVLSPAGNFFLICVICRDHQRVVPVYVLDAVSGDLLHTLMPERSESVDDFKFISDEVCVVFSTWSSAGSLHLYNVKSGDLLSVVHLTRRRGKVHLAACLDEHLVAIAFSQCRIQSGFKVLRVWLRGDKESRKNSKR